MDSPRVNHAAQVTARRQKTSAAMRGEGGSPTTGRSNNPDLLFSVTESQLTATSAKKDLLH